MEINIHRSMFLPFLCRCKTSSPGLREERRLWILQNGVWRGNLSLRRRSQERTEINCTMRGCCVICILNQLFVGRVSWMGHVGGRRKCTVCFSRELFRKT